MNTKTKGSTIELLCMARFVQLGYTCLIPYGDNARYDFVVETNPGNFVRIQCKTAQWNNPNKETFTISCKSSNTLRGKYINKKYNQTEIDYFATYINNQVYVIPILECELYSKTIRVKVPSNDCGTCTYASDYTIEKYFGSGNKHAEIENNYTTKTIYKCKKCGTEVHGPNSLCQRCAHELSRKIEGRPSKTELKNLIRNIPFTTIGQMFRVSDNCIRKWCKNYGLPFRKRDIIKYNDSDWLFL